MASPEEEVAEGETEPEPELTPQEQAAKYPEVVQHITVQYNGKEKIFNTNCWAVNLYDALRQVARADAAERTKAALGDSKGMIEAAKATLAELAAEGARGEEETEEDFNARVAAAEEAAATAETDFADLKMQPTPSDIVDLADANTGQLQGVNIRGKQVLANTFIKTRTVYILTRIEKAKDEETGEETDELAYVPMIPPLEKDDEGNDIEPEGYVKFEPIAPEPVPEEGEE